MMSAPRAEDDDAEGRGDRLRVLSLIKGLGPGGAEQLLVSMAKASDRTRFEHEVAYLLPWKDALVSALEDVGVRTHCFGVDSPTRSGWLGQLDDLLEAGRFDVVHLHSPLVAGRTRLHLARRRWRPAIVSTEHNVWSSHTRRTMLLNAATFPLGDAWIAVSAEVRRSIPRILRGRVEVVVHGLVLEEAREQLAYREEIRRELGARDDEVLVCTVANFRRQKGYPDLLTAAAAVVAQNPKVRFVAVGQGPLEQEIRDLHAEMKLGDRVMLLGYRPDAIRILAACDLFTLASIYEGYPVAVMEAIAVGLPVVATSVGGVPEAVIEGVDGHLVPPSRPDLLADAILDLAGDPDRRAEMGRAALERSAIYDIRVAARRCEAIYSRVAAARVVDTPTR